MKLIRYEHPTLDELDQVFGLNFTSFGRPGQLEKFFESPRSPSKVPTADIHEDENYYFVTIELPGIKKDEIELKLENSVLTLGAQSKDAKENCSRSYSFSRSFAVPEGVDTEKINAALDHGVLTLSLPKTEQSKPRKIKVN